MKNHFLHTLLACLLSTLTLNCLAQGDVQPPKIYYVDAAKANNSGDGLSWAGAKKDIQAAINLATSIDQVWVKAGTYYPTDIPSGLTASGANSPVSNRDKTLLLKDGVKIYGGFAGTELLLSQRITGSNQTIIDGDIGTPGDSTDNCYHLMVYLGSYSTAGVTIDGFTLRNGTAGTWGGSVPPYDASSLTIGGIPYGIVRWYGGGIYMQQGLNNVINNVVFEKNYAKNRGFGLWTDGGFGLFCSYTVTNCYFVNNYGIESTYGCWATNFGKNNGYNLVFYNNNILNFGFGAGVGIFLFDGLNKLVNCSFVNNNSIMGGVVNLANGAKSYFTNCLFYNNKQSTIYNTDPNAPDFFDSEFAGSFGKFTNCSMSADSSFYTASHYTMAAGSANNIFSQDPAFADINSLTGTDGKYYTTDDGLALPPGTPCKNAGKNDSIPVSLTKDITGANRIMGTTVDIGAYEIDAAVACTPPAAPVTANQTFCESASATVANLTATGSNIKWYAAATGGLPLTPTTPLTNSTKYYASQTIGTCESVVRAVDSVTINPPANVNPVSNKIVCNGSAIPAINFSTTTIGGTVTYSWTNNKTSIGLAASGTGNIASFTAVNNGTAPDTATILVTPTITNGGVSCVGTKDSFYIVVNPVAIVNPIADKVLCNGATFTAVTPTSTATGGTVSYTWTNNTTSIGLAASGSGTVPAFTAVNNGTAPVTATVIVTPLFSNGGANCAGIADTFLITVNPTAAVSAISNQVVCNNTATAAVNFSSTATGGTVVYNWTNNNTSIGLGANGSGNIASFTATNSGTAPITATITVTPSYTNAGTTCTGTAQLFTITVNPTATVNAITNKAVCNGSSIAAEIPTSPTTGGSISYAWTNNNTAIGLPAGGVGNVPAFTVTNTGTSPAIATITITPAFTNGGVSCTGTARTYTITVNPTAAVNTVSNQVLCNGSATAAINFGNNTTGGTVAYAWTNTNTSIGLAASGNGNIASFTAANNGTAPATATITVTPTYTSAGVSCQGTAQTFTISVNPTAVVNAISNKAVCNGSTVAAVNFSSQASGGTLTYNWTNNTPSIGLAANGTGNIASFNAINTGFTSVTATITVTPTFTNGSVSCTGTPQSFAITVNPTAVVNAVSNQTVCADITNNAVSFSSPVAGTTYSWINSNPSIGLAASGAGTVPSFTAQNASPNATNAAITVTPNTPAGCIGQPITYTITVNGKSVAPTSVSNPTPIVCANNAFATLTVSGGALGSGATWKWYADSLNTVSIGSGATLSNIAVAKTTTYFVRAEGTCNNTAAASIVVQRANLVHQVRQHWSDVLLFDNSSNNYVAWQWYKNGVAVAGANMQQYSENTALAGTYYVVATDKNGVQFISCPLTIAAGAFTGLKISLFPNPADKGANVTISTSFTANELQGANITVTDVFGRVIQQMAQVTPTTAIQAPAATGMYIVTLTLQNGMKYSANLLTK